MEHLSVFEMTDGACPSADRGDCTNTISSVGELEKNGKNLYKVTSGLF